MRKILMFLSCLSVSLGWGSAVATLSDSDVTTRADLLAAASAANKHVAILFTGSDWCEAGGTLWTNYFPSAKNFPVTTNSKFSGFITTVVDQPEVGYSAASTQNSNLRTLFPLGSQAGCRQYAFPAIGLYDETGKLYALYSSVEMTKSSAEMANLFASSKANYLAYLTARAAAFDLTEEDLQAFASSADSGLTWREEDSTAIDSSGNVITLDIYKASKLAKAFLLLEPNVFRFDLLNSSFSLSSDVSQLRTWDPDDVSGGWRRLFKWDYFNDGYAARERAGSGAYAVAEAEFLSLTNDTKLVKLSKNQYQQSLLTVYVYNMFRGRTEIADALAQRAMDVDQYTLFGEAAIGRWALRSKGPATLTKGWFTATTESQSTENSAFDWTIDRGCDFQFDAKGWYTFSVNWTGGADVTIDSLSVTQNGTNVFSSADTAAKFDPYSDNQWKNVSWPVTLNNGNKSVTVRFFLPNDTERKLPLFEKDEGGGPESVNVKISGVMTAPSRGTFSVTPHVAFKKDDVAAGYDTTTFEPLTFASAKQETLRTKEEAAILANPQMTYAQTVDSLLTNDVEYAMALSQLQTVNSFGASSITKQAEAIDDVQTILMKILSNQDWMLDLWCSGPMNDTSSFLTELSAIWRADERYKSDHPSSKYGTIATDEQLRKNAWAMALNSSNPIGLLVRNYQMYRNFMDREKLHGKFYEFDVRERRFALNPQNFDYRDLQYCVNSTGGKISSYGMAAWQVNYRLWNFFGDSVFGNDYSRTWQHKMGAYTGHRYLGAVCGGISYYGIHCVVAHGNIGVTGGQPGHCAFLTRDYDAEKWSIQNYVSHWTGAHFTFYGLNNPDGLAMFDDMFRDLASFRRSMQIAWAAKYRDLRNGETGYTDNRNDAYRLALTVSPANYQLWTEYAQWLESVLPASMPHWQWWADGVAAGLVKTQQSAWTLLNRFYVPKAKANWGTEGLLLAYRRLYRNMPESTRKAAEVYNFAAVLSTQFSQLNNQAPLMTALLETILDVNYGKANYPALATQWGTSQITDPAHQADFLKTLTAVHAAHGNSTDLATITKNMIKSASASQDLQLFNDACNAYDEQSGNRIVSSEANLFPETLVSAHGLLTLSSYTSSISDCQNARRVIDDSAFGTYNVLTDAESMSPWILLTLPNTCSLSGIVIQNASGEHATKSIPFSVEISADGLSWSTVLESSGRSVSTLSIPLPDNPQAKYVKVTRIDSSVTTAMSLQKFQVFGTQLY